MCSHNNVLNSREGVIRSNSKALRGRVYRRKERKCRKEFLFSLNKTAILEINVSWLNLNQGDILRVLWMHPVHGCGIKKLTRKSHLRIKGKYFKLEWKQKSTPGDPVQRGQGFVLFYSFIDADVGMEPITRSNDLSSDSEISLFSSQSTGSSARLSWFLERQESPVRLQCSRGSQILIVNVKAVSRSRPQCTGITPGILVDRNDCFWKRKCFIRMANFSMVRTLLTSPCRTYLSTNDMIMFQDLMCVRTRSIIDICSGVSISLKHGVIRSHAHVPWYYSARNHSCSIRLPEIQLSHVLNLQTISLDYDRMHDRLRVRHVTTGGLASNVRMFQGSSHLFKDGHVEITWDIYSDSRSGSGFIILFKFLQFN